MRMCSWTRRKLVPRNQVKRILKISPHKPRDSVTRTSIACSSTYHMVGMPPQYACVKSLIQHHHHLNSSHLIIVKSDLSWQLFIHNHEVLCIVNLSSMRLQFLNCCRQASCDIQKASSSLMLRESFSVSVSAFVDHNAPVKLNGEISQKTVRTSGSEM